MTQSQVEVAAGISYSASVTGIAVGNWLSENWLAILSAVFIIATYTTQLVFTLRKDKREKARQEREEERHHKMMKAVSNARDT